MSFIPKQHSSQLQSASSRDEYLTPGKVKADGQVRFAMLANEPLCYFEVWGQDETGKPKPFRFAEEASAEDIEQEMGVNYKRTVYDDGNEAPQKFAISVPIYNYDINRVQILSMSQKNLIKEFDQISQVEEYSDMTEWDFIMTKSATVSPDMYGLRPVPRKKGTEEAVKAAWDEALKDGFDINRLLLGTNPFKAD